MALNADHDCKQHIYPGAHSVLHNELTSTVHSFAERVKFESYPRVVHTEGHAHLHSSWGFTAPDGHVYTLTLTQES